MRKKKPVENKDLEFAKPMGRATKGARDKTGFTQAYVSESTGVDTRTIMNIENGEGNPTMEKLYPLVRFYGIDPKAFFYPELKIETSARTKLRLLLETCTEQEAEDILPIVRAILNALNSKNSGDLKVHSRVNPVKKEPAP